MLEPSQTDVDDRLSVGAEFDSPVAGSSEAKERRSKARAALIDPVHYSMMLPESPFKIFATASNYGDEHQEKAVSFEDAQSQAAVRTGQSPGSRPPPNAALPPLRPARKGLSSATTAPSHPSLDASMHAQLPWQPPGSLAEAGDRPMGAVTHPAASVPGEGDGPGPASRWQRAGAAAALPSDPSLGLSPHASPELKRLVHPRFIEPQALVKLRAHWATPPPKWHASSVQRFEASMRELSDGLDAWERMEDQQAKQFHDAITAAFAKLAPSASH